MDRNLFNFLPFSGASAGRAVSGRSFSCFFAGALFFSIPLAAVGEEPLDLTLGEALTRVESENLRVLLNREAIEQAIQNANRERSFLFPRIDLEASQTRSQVSTVGRGFDAPSTPASNRFDARVRGQVPLLAPSLIASYQAAKVGVDISEYDYELLLQEVLNATAQTYLAHLRNLARFDVIMANIERDEALLQLARNRFDAGVATQIDVTRAELQLALEQQARLQQETVVYESSLQLKRLLNIRLGIPIVLEDFVAHRVVESAEPDVDADVVLGDRFEYLSLRRLLERNRLEERAAAWERLPTISLFGDYGFVTSRAFDGNEDDSWAVGVSASVPVFEGFRIRSNRRLAQSRRRATEIEIEDFGDEVEAELLVAWQDMRSRLAQIEVAEQNVSLAEEELRLARISFEQGVVDNRALIDAQNRVSQINDNLVEAIFLYNLSRLEYSRARGDVRLLLGDQVIVNR